MTYIKVFLIMALMFAMGGCTDDTSLEDNDGDGVNNLSDCAPLDNSKWNNIAHNSTDFDSDKLKGSVTNDN